uniref:Matrix-remodeling-associated protein 7 n=1 Tax=Globodera pallida TaxID=36090 RepID=A0A183C997_GLOPA
MWALLALPVFCLGGIYAGIVKHKHRANPVLAADASPLVSLAMTDSPDPPVQRELLETPDRLEPRLLEAARDLLDLRDLPDRMVNPEDPANQEDPDSPDKSQKAQPNRDRPVLQDPTANPEVPESPANPDKQETREDKDPREMTGSPGRQDSLDIQAEKGNPRKRETEWAGDEQKQLLKP